MKANVRITPAARKFLQKQGATDLTVSVTLVSGG